MKTPFAVFYWALSDKICNRTVMWLNCSEIWLIEHHAYLCLTLCLAVAIALSMHCGFCFEMFWCDILWMIYPGSELQGDSSVTPDNDVFVHLAKTYSIYHATMQKANKCYDFKDFTDGITNGYRWYPLEGTFFKQKHNWIRSGLFIF